MVCLRSWVRQGATPVKVKVTSADANAQYGMVVVFLPRDPGEVLSPSLKFTRAQLQTGVQWQVPAFHWCEFSLACDRNSALDTVIELKGVEVFRSACKAKTAGLAGRWQVTTTR